MVFLALLAALLLSCEAQDCEKDMKTAGVTYPRGNIHLERSQPLQITCTLNKEEDLNAENIYFTEDHREIPKKFVTVINETTAELFIPDMSMVKRSLYFCRIRSKNDTKNLVCFNHVQVGLKPQPVQNFTCVSKNWQSLRCKWDTVDHGTPTFYRISWTLPGDSKPSHCPDDSDSNYNFCRWDLGTTPKYRPSSAHYSLTITGTNNLGMTTFKPIVFDHFAHVVLEPAIYVIPIAIASHSATLKLFIPRFLNSFPPGLTARVRYRHKWMSQDEWILAANATPIQQLMLDVAYLPYAYVKYTVQVEIKSAKASDLFYSEPTALIFVTSPEIPPSPRVDLGGFENEGMVVTSMRDVTLYWEPVPEYLHNGDQFGYRIEVADGTKEWRVINLTDKTASSVEIKHLSHNMHVVKIYAKNSVGLSDSPAVITVPSFPSRYKGTSAVTKFAHGNRKYELSWEKSTNSDLMSNYTIFWCPAASVQGNVCTGPMNWTHVPANVSMHNVTVPDDRIYEFAVSANYVTESTGLSWTSCTTAVDNLIVDMESVAISDFDYGYEISGTIGCWDRNWLVEGYNDAINEVEMYFDP